MDNNIRLYREMYGYSQSELAEFIGVSKNTVYMIEAGRTNPSLSTIVNLLQFFGCKFEQLFIFDVSPQLEFGDIFDDSDIDPESYFAVPLPDDLPDLIL